MASTGKTTGFIAIDIETTGKNFFTNVLFAIGIAWGDASGIQTCKIVVDLEKPPERSWEEHWQERQWEPRCWNEFWSKNVEALDALQKNDRLIKIDELSRVFNAQLSAIEELFDKTVLVFDAIAFDPVWTSTLLMRDGYNPLNYTRKGVHRWSYNVDSLTEGALCIDGNEEWARLVKERNERIDVLLPELGVTQNDHDPAHDAEHILAQYLRARAFCRTK